MQISGTAQTIETFSEQYIKAANFKKLPIEALCKMPELIHLIKIIPKRLIFLILILKSKVLIQGKA